LKYGNLLEFRLCDHYLEGNFGRYRCAVEIAKTLISDGLASFLKTTLANGVKVVKKVITSKFRFHLIAIYMHWGVFTLTPLARVVLRNDASPSEINAMITLKTSGKE
jgi:hypothetical protein